jgi:hypothetical protein
LLAAHPRPRHGVASDVKRLRRGEREMYVKGMTASSLPFTGMFLDVSWTILAAAMLIAVGVALLRLVPRSEA